MLIAGLLTVVMMGLIFNNESKLGIGPTAQAPKQAAPIVSTAVDRPGRPRVVAQRQTDQQPTEYRTDDDTVQHSQTAATSDLPAAPAQKTRDVSSRSATKTASAKVENPLAGDQRNGNGLGMKFVWCPPGTITMGSPKSENDSADSAHRVAATLSTGFWLGVYEVTQGEYARIMGHNPSRFSAQGEAHQAVAGHDTDRFPVERVSWDDALEFCRKLTDQERVAGRLASGWEYTLPTDAQWEYACRAATTTAYSFGNQLNGNEANCNGNYPYGTDARGPFLERTTTAGSYQANAWGLYDMHGNVWEWCRDFHAARPPGGVDPFVASGDSERVIRGGSWFSDARDCRTAYRLAAAVRIFRGHGVGFRVVLSETKRKRATD